ncbi:hypothetical protein H6G06_23775 [Anabaena sphaerica FACHB-251]|uniref:Uncharacterized protein n=1 Tax=Anabaena sphaerica FACHB-251 TaxID=2692883 RepID=A0A926WLN4_9NOST|nr:hypothetical protein [Anabaena sphaerica]MBD2296417.1 hypothetical protein [Anabaena sphaerica FACHB-251]
MNIDEAKIKFDYIRNEVSSYIDKIKSETDTRVNIIDRILIEVLGWEKEEIEREPHTASGFVDYLLKYGDKNFLVIEAKKIGFELIETTNQKVSSYKLGGAAIKPAKDGIIQASNYCLTTGATFAGLTNGICWIGFNPFPRDGKPLFDSNSITFPSLESISDKFAMFYDLFSKEGVLEKRYLTQIQKFSTSVTGYYEKLYSVHEMNNNRMIPKSDFQIDLDKFFNEFFTTLAGDNDPEMLIECFVETQDSINAERAMQKISENILNSIQSLNSGTGRELEKEIEFSIETEKTSDIVLIVGEKGSGKSTFIERFFTIILDKNVRSLCLALKIDMANSSGDINYVTKWIYKNLKDCIEKELYKGNSPEYEELQGIFYKEYQRWKNGEFKYLYEKDRQEFKIKFGEYIFNKKENNLEEYVINLLYHVVRSRKLMPCIVFDNTDNFSQKFQEAVFQVAESIHRAVFSFIIVPITDKTIWQLSKSGPFQSYDSKSFYLPVPSIKDILDKRIKFLKKKIETEKNGKSYFLNRGIRVKIDDIGAFVSCIEEIFVNEDFTSRRIGWIANHEIRRSLKVFQGVVTSPCLGIDELVKSYILGNMENINPQKITKSLILGEYKGFAQEHSQFILNLFTLKNNLVSSPLTKIRILRLLRDKEASSNDVHESYLTLQEIENYFEPMCVNEDIIVNYIKELISYRLLQTYDPSDDKVYSGQRLSITSCGKIHIEMIMNDEIYISQMALVTEIRDISVVEKIRKLGQQGLNAREYWNGVISTFIEYCLEEDKIFVRLPKDNLYRSQQVIIDELSKWK